MVRSILVQEGVPIYGPGSEAVSQVSQNNDHAMESRPRTVSAPSSRPHKMSSLQRAAGASASHRKEKSNGRSSYSKKKTSYTIGGASTVEAKTTTSSSYSHSSSWTSPGQPSADLMEARTQQRHSTSYTVSAPQHELPAPSPVVAHNAKIENDNMMEDEPTPSHSHNSNGYSSGNPTHHYHHQPINHATLGSMPHVPATPTSYVVGGSRAAAPSQHYHHQTMAHASPAPMPPAPATPTSFVIGGSSATVPSHHYHQQPIPHASPMPQIPTPPTSYVIGDSRTVPPSQLHSTEKMEGVQDHGSKMPLVVLDGANVAHYYADALAAMNTTISEKKYRKGKPEPDARGIQVATDYFTLVGVRVLVVLPQYWMRKKPRPGDSTSQNAMMETNQFDILKDLDDKGLIVASPPTDDDDAYALTIAKREELRAVRQRNGEGPGFVLSNDMFRDAQARDRTGVLKEWLKQGRNESIGPGRISYAFCDMGTMDDHGDRILDFVPNPRHPFVNYVEGLHHQTILVNK